MSKNIIDLLFYAFYGKGSFSKLEDARNKLNITALAPHSNGLMPDH